MFQNWSAIHNLAVTRQQELIREARQAHLAGLARAHERESVARARSSSHAGRPGGGAMARPGERAA